VKLVEKSKSSFKIYSYYDGLDHKQYIYKVYPNENKVIQEILKDVQDENERITGHILVKI
jgi:hypothetical protein